MIAIANVKFGKGIFLAEKIKFTFQAIRNCTTLNIYFSKYLAKNSQIFIKNKSFKKLYLVQTINIILGAQDTSSLADLNEDGIINILDVVLMINIVLNP